MIQWRTRSMFQFLRRDLEYCSLWFRDEKGIFSLSVLRFKTRTRKPFFPSPALRPEREFRSFNLMFRTRSRRTKLYLRVARMNSADSHGNFQAQEYSLGSALRLVGRKEMMWESREAEVFVRSQSDLLVRLTTQQWEFGAGLLHCWSHIWCCLYKAMLEFLIRR